jgi:hypothetical protein
MSRKSFVLGLALLAVLVGGVAGALALLVLREPEDYLRSDVPPGEERQQHSQEFQAKCVNLYNGMKNDRVWQEKFTDAQINSYFDEDFVRSGFSEQFLPQGISQPRVSITADRIRLAFRYGTEAWCSTVVTLDFRVWLCPQETNVVALELQSLRAGSLPITAQSLLERITEVVRRQQDVEVTWYRLNGNPVALVRFQATQPRPTVRLERLELSDGQLVIGGRSAEAAPLRAMLGVPDGALKPAAD